MGSNQKKPKVTLEALLQIKRNERPENAFWDSFEADFQRRRLHSLLEAPTIRDYLWNPAVKALAFGVPALLIVGMTFFWSRVESPSTPAFASSQDVPALDTGDFLVAANSDPTEMSPRFTDMRSSLSSSQFVLDAIESAPAQSSTFRKVLYTPAIRLSGASGASYVRDNLNTSSGYKVSTANLKAGRNF